MKIFGTLLVMLLLFSCDAPRALYDYDLKADFNQYSTYSFYPDLRTGLSELDERRLLGSIRRGLQEEGLSFSEEPDLFIDVYSQEYRQNKRNRLGVGIGGGGGNIGVGVSGGIPLGGPETYVRLTFDFIDVSKDVLVWQAVVRSPFDLGADPAERQEQFDRIVEEALAGYPPGNK